MKVRKVVWSASVSISLCWKITLNFKGLQSESTPFTVMVTEVLCYFPDIHKCRWSTCRDSAEEAGIGGLLWGYYMLWNYQSSSRVCQGPAQWFWCCSITTTDCLQTIPRGNEAGYSPCRSRPCKDSKYHISLAFCIWTWAAVWPKLKSWKTGPWEMIYFWKVL